MKNTMSRRASLPEVKTGMETFTPVLQLNRVWPGPFVHWKTIPETRLPTKWVVVDANKSAASSDTSSDFHNEPHDALSFIELTEEQTREMLLWDYLKTKQQDKESSLFTVTSFQGKGEAELIRLIFSVAKVQYIDTRVTEEEYEEIKNSLPYGKLPILSKGDNHWGELSAIVRALAKKYSLLGFTIKDQFQVEATYERLRRVQVEHSKPIMWVAKGEKNKEKMEWAQNQMTSLILPSVFKEWEALIRKSPGPFIIENGMTLADIAIMDFVDQCSQNLIIGPLLAAHPAVSDLIMMVQRHPRIAKYLDGRENE